MKQQQQHDIDTFWIDTTRRTMILTITLYPLKIVLFRLFKKWCQRLKLSSCFWHTHPVSVLPLLVSAKRSLTWISVARCWILWTTFWPQRSFSYFAYINHRKSVIRLLWSADSQILWYHWYCFIVCRAIDQRHHGWWKCFDGCCSGIHRRLYIGRY